MYKPVDCLLKKYTRQLKLKMILGTKNYIYTNDYGIGLCMYAMTYLKHMDYYNWILIGDRSFMYAGWRGHVAAL